MKKICILFSILFLSTSQITAQTTYWVSNRQDGIQVDFTNLQTAINTAGAGDILMVYPSQNGYGSITINKPVQIIGLGYLPGISTQPTLNITTESNGSIAGNISIEAGADGGSISGMDFSSIAINNVSGFEVRRCKVTRFSGANSSNLTVAASYFTGIPFNTCGGGCYNVVLSQVAGAMFENNIFTYENQYTVRSPSGRFGDNVSISSTCSAITFQQNIFHDFVYTHNSEILNNVFLSSGNCNNFDPISGNCTNITMDNIIGTNNSVHDNIFVADVSNLYPMNIVGVAAGAIFVGHPDANGHSFDLRYQLAPGSPAASAGQGGADCGVYGGNRPYKPSGIYKRPLIYELTTDPEAPVGGSLRVNLKVRSEN